MTSGAVSIVVPTYKEASNIPLLAQRLFETLGRANIAAELVFVDDDSRDGSEQVVAELARTWPVRLITRTNERGLSSAVIRGFEEAKYDILLCMDADLSHPPEAVPSMIDPIATGEADFVIGSRYVAGGSTREDWGVLRRINSLVATALARPLTTVKDPMAGFFCLTRETYLRAKTAGLSAIGYKIGLELLIKARCSRVREIPIDFSDRMHGKSKLTFQQQLEYLIHLSRLYRFKRPIFSCMAALVIAAMLFSGGWLAAKLILPAK
jgi:dolichol-phosphate mannosyltransferase